MEPRGRRRTNKWLRWDGNVLHVPVKMFVEVLVVHHRRRDG